MVSNGSEKRNIEIAESWSYQDSEKSKPADHYRRAICTPFASFSYFLSFSFLPFPTILFRYANSSNLFFAPLSSLSLSAPFLHRPTLLTSAKLNTAPRKSWRRLSRIFRSILDAWSRSISTVPGRIAPWKKGGEGQRKRDRSTEALSKEENSTGRRKFVRGID